MRKLRTEKTAEVKEFRLRLEHLKTHKDQSTKLKSDVSEGQDKDRNYMVQINDLQEQAKVCLFMMHHLSALALEPNPCPSFLVLTVGCILPSKHWGVSAPLALRAPLHGSVYSSAWNQHQWAHGAQDPAHMMWS